MPEKGNRFECTERCRAPRESLPKELGIRVPGTPRVQQPTDNPSYLRSIRIMEPMHHVTLQEVDHRWTIKVQRSREHGKRWNERPAEHRRQLRVLHKGEPPRLPGNGLKSPIQPAFVLDVLADDLQLVLSWIFL